MTEHKITATEPMLVTQTLRWNKEHEVLLEDELVDKDLIAGEEETKYYNCECGKHFETFEQAEEHIRGKVK